MQIVGSAFGVFVSSLLGSEMNGKVAKKFQMTLYPHFCVLIVVGKMLHMYITEHGDLQH